MVCDAIFCNDLPNFRCNERKPRVTVDKFNVFGNAHVIWDPICLQGSTQAPPQPSRPSELFYSKMTPALKEKVTSSRNFRRFFQRLVFLVSPAYVPLGSFAVELSTWSFYFHPFALNPLRASPI